MVELLQNTTLLYCLVDNCTIMRIDTGQQMDIVYTTQSLLVVTPMDGQTSVIISKNEPELSCSPLSLPGTKDDIKIQLAEAFMLILLILESGYIFVVHLIFKKLRSTFGKMMMFYNIGLIFQCVNMIVLSITRYNIPVHSSMSCYIFFFLFMQLEIIGEEFATCTVQITHNLNGPRVE